MKSALTVALAIISMVACHSASYYVSPKGRSGGKGTMQDPWDLATALYNTVPGGAHPIRPGDTVWLRGGVYTAGRFSTRLVGVGENLFGTPDAPIVLRNYRSEVPILDGPLVITRADHVWFWGLHITLMEPPPPVSMTRLDQDNAINAGQYRRGNLEVQAGTGLKFINCVFHGNYGSANVGQSATDTEVYGCLWLGNGRHASDYSSGHGLYLQSRNRALLRDCIFANNFLNGLNPYSGGDALVNGVAVDGSILFGNGFGFPRSVNVLAGTAVGVTNFTLANSILYNHPEPNANIQALNVELGYGGTSFHNPVLVSNKLINGGLLIRPKTVGSVVGNRLETVSGVLVRMRGSPIGMTWDRNAYQSKYSTPFDMWDSFTNFTGWKVATGFDANGSTASIVPTYVASTVQTNLYELGRAHVTIVNWGLSNRVEVDFGSIGLQVGQRYVIRAVQDLFGPAITNIFAGGSVSFPMTNWTVAQPRSHALALGDAAWLSSHPKAAALKSTFPQFGAFLVEPLEYARYTIEAEEMTVSGSGATASDVGASGGQFVDIDASEGGAVTFTLEVPSADEYFIWWRARRMGTAVGAMYVSVDGETEWTCALRTPSVPVGWSWSEVVDSAFREPRPVRLVAGTHTVRFRMAAEECSLDQVLVTNQRDFMPPTPPTAVRIPNLGTP